MKTMTETKYKISYAELKEKLGIKEEIYWVCDTADDNSILIYIREEENGKKTTEEGMDN